MALFGVPLVLVLLVNGALGKKVMLPSSDRPTCQKVICVVNHWSVDRGEGSFDFQNIPGEMCTHIHMALGPINHKKGELKKFGDQKTKNLRHIVALKQRNPELKIILPVGGWKFGTEFASIPLTYESRVRFARSAVDILRSNDIDGLDIKWKYPTRNLTENSPEEEAERKRFTLLLRDIWTVFDADAFVRNKTRLSLSASLGGGHKWFSKAYEVNEIHKYLDYATIMAYKHNEGSVMRARHQFPLFQGSSEYFPIDWVSKSIRDYTGAGFPKNKLVLGLSAFGRSYTLKSLKIRKDSKPGARTNCDQDDDTRYSCLGKAGNYTKRRGILAYFEICTFVKDPDTKLHRIKGQNAHYARNGKQWVAFDTPYDIRQKVRYALSKKLSGVNVFTVDYDDFTGEWCKEEGRPTKTFPILKAVVRACGRET